MNMIYLDNGKIYNNFKDYLLSESISIQKTKYGVNSPVFDDLNILNNQQHKMTFFESQGTYVVNFKPQLTTDGPEVIFTKLKSFVSVTDFEVYREITKDMNQFKIFGKVMYIIIQMMKKLKINKVYFDGMTKKHSEVYTKLFTNKHIQKEAKKYNIKLSISDDKFYVEM